MTLNESIVDDTALTLPAATLTRPLPLGDRIRGSVKQGTLWHVSREDTKTLRAGIRRHPGGA
jgi:hypothetical protein